MPPAAAIHIVGSQPDRARQEAARQGADRADPPVDEEDRAPDAGAQLVRDDRRLHRAECDVEDHHADPGEELGGGQQRHRGDGRAGGQRDQEQRQPGRGRRRRSALAEAEPRAGAPGDRRAEHAAERADPERDADRPRAEPSSWVAKRTSSAQKAVLKRLKVAVPSSAACSSGVPRMKRMPAARSPAPAARRAARERRRAVRRRPRR